MILDGPMQIDLFLGFEWMPVRVDGMCVNI